MENAKSSYAVAQTQKAKESFTGKFTSFNVLQYFLDLPWTASTINVEF